MNAEPLVVTTREVASEFADPASHAAGGAIENVHYGSIAVVSADGRLLHGAGDPDYLTFTRSTLKPFQALPFVREGGHTHFGWGLREVALMCASHSGEAMHTEVVAAMLASSGSDESQLQCGCHVPGWYAALDRTPLEGARFAAIEHNCSGKHAGFLAACRLHGERVEDYLQPTSPVQRRVAAAIADMTGLAESALTGRSTIGLTAGTEVVGEIVERAHARGLEPRALLEIACDRCRGSRSPTRDSRRAPPRGRRAMRSASSSMP